MSSLESRPKSGLSNSEAIAKIAQVCCVTYLKEALARDAKETHDIKDSRSLIERITAQVTELVEADCSSPYFQMVHRIQDTELELNTAVAQMAEANMLLESMAQITDSYEAVIAEHDKFLDTIMENAPTEPMREAITDLRTRIENISMIEEESTAPVEDAQLDQSEITQEALESTQP